MQDNVPMARIANIVLGVWLFISAFLWRHTYSQMTNTWILGLLCVAFAAIAIKVPQVRYLNAVLAVWLFISAWALPTFNVGTIWNNALVAVAVFIISLAPGYVGRGPRTVTRP